MHQFQITYRIIKGQVVFTGHTWKIPNKTQEDRQMYVHARSFSKWARKLGRNWVWKKELFST